MHLMFTISTLNVIQHNGVLGLWQLKSNFTSRIFFFFSEAAMGMGADFAHLWVGAGGMVSI